MSDQELDAVVGKIAREYAEAKRKREALRSILQSGAGELGVVAERILSGAFENARTLFRKQIMEEFGLERLKALLDEHAEMEALASDLQRKLRDLGVTVD